MNDLQKIMERQDEIMERLGRIEEMVQQGLDPEWMIDLVAHGRAYMRDGNHIPVSKVEKQPNPAPASPDKALSQAEWDAACERFKTKMGR